MKTDRQTYTGLSEIKLERGQQCDNLNSTDNNGYALVYYEGV